MNLSFRFPRPLFRALCFLAQALAASGITFTNDTLISAGNTSFDGQDIVVTNCSLTVDGTHSFASLQVLNGGILTHSFNSNPLPVSDGLNLTITNNVQIEIGGAIDVSGRGYPGGFGLGAGTSRSTNSPFLYSAGSGGGYGGFGGSSSTLASGGASYGAIANPVQKGSGGGAGLGVGGAGGGVVQLVAGGLLRVDGQILANGADGLHPYSGGGAGGSVLLSAQSFSGHGTISADGGAGEPYDGGGGGGGRIAIYVSGSILAGTNQFEGALSARGGPGAVTGGAGTIYLRGKSDAIAELRIDNGGDQGTNTPLSAVDSCDVTISGGALVQSGATSPIHNLVIHSNSWLFQTPKQVLVLTVSGDAQIDAGAGISGNGAGFPAGQGLGHGGTTLFVPSGTTGGGGFGGYGGSSVSNAPGGIAYNSTTEPSDFGSGGGGNSESPGGAGGGAVRLQVQGTLDLEGTISVNGANGIHSGFGGGSGGSLFISAASFSGIGSITADGGAGESIYGGGGGGGRIALQIGTNLFAGVISARGGTGANYGGAGTVYVQTQTNPISQVTVDNGGRLATNTLVTGLSGQTDLKLSSGALVILTNSQIIHNLVIQSNSWLVGIPGTLARVLTVTGNANIAGYAGILLDGKGYPAGQGQGAPLSSRNAAGGGGYGGYGGSSAFGNPGGNAYGSAFSPDVAGSGGGISFENVPATGGAGGGNIQLRVTGTLALAGIISANGGAASVGGGGGSGGSLWITVGALSGAGLISANGGAGDGMFGGGGGGGRIQVTYATNQFTGSIVALGGPGAVYGGAGTVYLTTQRVGPAQLLVDNGGNIGTNTLLTTQISPMSDLTIRGGATAVVGIGTSILNLRQLLISSNSWLSVVANNQQPSPLQINLTGPSRLEAGGGINLDAKGSYFGLGAGKFVLTQALGYTGGGGGHGGYGGASIANAAGGTAYGSATPNEPGSGGGAENPQLYGAPGGGALRLFSTNSLVLDGLISVNGADARIPGGGGGSGGGIWLNIGSLSGSGLISANGGEGDLAQGGGGGGGRIAIYSTPQNSSNAIPQFSGTIQAFGGAGFLNGGAGTVYLAAFGLVPATIRIDNGGLAGAITPVPAVDLGAGLQVFGGAVASAPPYPGVWNGIVVDSGASLIQSALATNVALTVFGDMFIATNCSVSADGLGYSSSNGGPGAGSMSSNTGGSGGGYGGAGGASVSGLAGGKTYGSAQQPTDRGSRGGLFPIVSNFCQGGGAIQLQVTRTLTVDGKISANGNDAQIESAGGGAGGSVWVTTRKLVGIGSISANGGRGDPAEGGGGGGGRIALYSGTNLYTGTVSALGGGGVNRGNDGTILINDLPPLHVASQTPTDIISYAVSSIDLSFSSPLDQSSVSNTTIVLIGPEGVISAPGLHLGRLSSTGFELTFPVQDTVGYYELSIPAGLQDIFGVTMNQPYQGSFIILPPVISGRVVDTNNSPVPYVTLSTYGEFLPILTDTNGFYSLEVLPSWTGTVTPAKAGWMFVPRTRSYSNLDTSATNQDFVMVSTNPVAVVQKRLGPNLKLQWFGITGMTYQALASTNLVDWWPSQPACFGSNQLMNLTMPLGAEPVKFFRLDASD